MAANKVVEKAEELESHLGYKLKEIEEPSLTVLDDSRVAVRSQRMTILRNLGPATQ